MLTKLIIYDCYFKTNSTLLIENEKKIKKKENIKISEWSDIRKSSRENRK